MHWGSAAVYVFVGMPQCFPHVSTSVKLLPPPIFCHSSGVIFNWRIWKRICKLVKRHTLCNSEEQTRNQTHKDSSGYQGQSTVVIWNKTQEHWSDHYKKMTRDHYLSHCEYSISLVVSESSFLLNLKWGTGSKSDYTHTHTHTHAVAHTHLGKHTHT